MNWSSPRQVLEVLHARGVTLPADASGRESTADEALAQCTDPLAGLLRQYRRFKKRAGYGPAYLRYVEEDGKIHPVFHQLGADTGRFSCSEPNLQNIPREEEYRARFVADPGSVLAIGDYAQIELRMAAHLYGDQVMTRAFREGRDLHRLTASRIYRKPEEEVTSDERSRAKQVNFGFAYGSGWRRFQSVTFAETGIWFTDEEAQAARRVFFETYRTSRPTTSASRRRTRPRSGPRWVAGSC